MRTLSVIFCSIFFCMVGWAQHEDSQTRTITLKVLDKKERPVRNILVQSVNTGKAGFTDRSGVFVFEDMTDDDKIAIMMKNNGQIVIPVSNMDFIAVKTVSSKLYSYEQNGEIKTAKIERPLAADDQTILDVQAMLKIRSYNSLIDLLRGNVAGLNITPNTNISASGGTGMTIGRGPTSINAGTEPLVVLNGVPLGSINDANAMVNIHSIKTIEVNKNGAGYGVRGANGIIAITTQ